MRRALDLFCGAGGATKGLQRAGFHVTGVDINRQPRYCGDDFIQGDAINPPVDLRLFDFIWASPPCQAFSSLRALHPDREYPNLIPQTRSLLTRSGVQFAIENVEGSPLGDTGNLVFLCGTMFGLTTPDGSAELRRHRLFETSFSIGLRPRCDHGPVCVSIHGDHARDRRRRAISVTGSTPQTNVNRNREAAGSILLRPLPKTTPRWVAITLSHAYAHLYAVMAFDFVRKAESEIIGTSGVRMGDGSVKTSRQFLAEDLIETMICKLENEQGSSAHTSLMRSKFSVLMESLAQGIRLNAAAGKEENSERL